MNSSYKMANSPLPLKSGACVKGQGYMRVQYSGSCMYEIIVHSTGLSLSSYYALFWRGGVKYNGIQYHTVLSLTW